MMYRPLHARSRIARGRAGFTLLELLVSVAVASFILFTVNAVFRSVTDAARQGRATGEILRTTRVVGDQLQRDFKHIVGPAEGGVLVIVNHRIEDAPLIEDHIEDGPRWDVRSDQIMFLRDRAELEPIAPDTDDALAPGDSRAAHVRLWLGHLRRVAPDGVTDYAPLGDAGANADRADPNELAARWLLGRQALFLEPSDGIQSIHANGAWADAEVAGADSAAPTALYMAVSDLAEFGLLTLNENNGGLAGFVETGANDNASPAPPRLFPSMSPADFRDAVARYLYIGEGQRLRANPVPDEFEPWKIAQMHAIFAEHVSDFEVTFAGDYVQGPVSVTVNGNGAITSIDLAGATPGPDGELDVYEDGSGNIVGPVWYGEYRLNINGDEDYVNPPFGGSATSGVAALPFVADDETPGDVNPVFEDEAADTSDGIQLVDRDGDPVDVTHADQVFIFRHTQSLSGKANWPEMIRIRYRLHEQNGRLIGQMTPADQDGADNDDDGDIDEPDEGQESVFVSGRWFEHVFRIEPRRR